MLKSALFSVIFKVDNVEFREEYRLPYRTEEFLYFAPNMLSKISTLYKQAIKAIANDLGTRPYCIDIIKIMRIHNDLILEE